MPAEIFPVEATVSRGVAEGRFLSGYGVASSRGCFRGLELLALVANLPLARNYAVGRLSGRLKPAVTPSSRHSEGERRVGELGRRFPAHRVLSRPAGPGPQLFPT